MRGSGNYQTYTPTHHARQRMAQRNISHEDILFVLEYGRKFHRAGAVFFYLRERDISGDLRPFFQRLEGTVVVLSRETDEILTVYRNRQKGLHHIKCKLERSSRRPQVNFAI